MLNVVEQRSADAGDHPLADPRAEPADAHSEERGTQCERHDDQRERVYLAAVLLGDDVVDDALEHERRKHAQQRGEDCEHEIRGDVGAEHPGEGPGPPEGGAVDLLRLQRLVEHVVVKRTHVPLSRELCGPMPLTAAPGDKVGARVSPAAVVGPPLGGSDRHGYDAPRQPACSAPQVPARSAARPRRRAARGRCRWRGR